MLRRTVLHVSLCMLLAQHITGEPQNIDGLQNEDIVLCPVLGGELEEITWKLGNNKIAEYDLFKVKAYYGDFKEQSELNIKNGCLKIINITDRRDGLYTAELQIGGKLQYHVFKLKVYRPVSKPTVTCSVTDSNVTLLCEGDESLGDHYRWEGHENQVLHVTNEGKYLTFSKEENYNIEFTCIFSNLKSEERSDPVKNCFVPGGRSHIWVPILVFLAVLAGLIVWGYKYYSQSQGRKTADYQAVQNKEGNSEPTTKNNVQSTLPPHGPQQCDMSVNSKDEKSTYHTVQMEEGNSEHTTEINMQETLHGPQQCDVHVYETVNSKATEDANTGKKEVVNGTEESQEPDPGINEQSNKGSAEKGTQDEEQQRKEYEDAETSPESQATENANTGKKEVVNGTKENQEPDPGIDEQSNKGSAEKGTQDEEQQRKESEDAETSPESRDVTPSPDSPPQTTDLVNSPSTLKIAMTPPPPGDVKDSSPPGDVKDSSPPAEGKGPSPPGDIKDSSHPGDSKDTSTPGDSKDSSPPGDGNDSSPPGDGKDSSHPGDSKDSSPLGDGKGSSPPGDGKDSSPPGDGKDSSPPGDDKDSSPPGDGKDSSHPGDSKDSSHPGDDKDSSPPGEGKGSSRSGADKASRT